MHASRLKYLALLLFFVFTSDAIGAQDSTEKKSVIRSVVDMLAARQDRYTYIVGRKIVPITKERILQDVMPVYNVHFDTTDAAGSSAEPGSFRRLNQGDFIDSRRVQFRDDPKTTSSEMTWYQLSHPNTNYVFLSTPVFSGDKQSCLIELYYSSAFECYLLKKNSTHNWQVIQRVGGAIICGTVLNRDEYFKLTGKKFPADTSGQ